MKTPYERLAKLIPICTGHMTKMATMPIYGKNHLFILFSGTKKANDLGTWYVALGMWALPDMHKPLI